jgi:GT2 family glycosyltransferase
MNAILTIVRNSTHVLHDFFESYKNYASDSDLYIWDNASRVQDYEYLESMQKEYNFSGFRERNMSSPDKPYNYLFTKATNNLIKLAIKIGKEKNIRYDQFIICNPDVNFLKDWHKDLEFNSGIMGFVLVKPYGVIEHAGGYSGGDHLGRGELDVGQFDTIREVDWCTFGAVAISRDVIDKIGVLDEKYPHFGSDREYCKKAKQAGFRIVCSPRRLIHHFGKSSKPYIFDQIPDDIWRLFVAERRASGVHFPDRQEDCKRVDAPGRYS